MSTSVPSSNGRWRRWSKRMCFVSAYGGGAVGEYLTSHDLADSIHMTGSDKTHDAIVFDSGPEGAERKRRGEVLTTAR